MAERAETGAIDRPQGLRAGFVSRVSADLVDGAVVVIAGALIVALVAMVRSLVGSRAFELPGIQVSGALGGGSGLLFVYLTFFWGTTGKTLGKQLVGLRVVLDRGAALRMSRAALRAALCVLFPFGLLWVLVSRRNASVQDLLLGTAVIYDWRPKGTQIRGDRP